MLLPAHGVDRGMTTTRAVPGRYGVWARKGDLNGDVARELERLGFGTVWIGNSPDGDLALVEELLGATQTLTVATGIVNIWKDDARAVAAAHRRVTEAYPDRFLLGIGVGHPEATSDYRRPYRALVAYLDTLDAEGVPADQRVLAALGPKVLRLAAERAAGAHPYLTTPAHTRAARAELGEGPLLAPEQKIVLDADPQTARRAARGALKYYLGLRNYVDNLRRSGFTDEDVAGEGSDRLVDALVGHGTPTDAAAAVTAHLDAGADHVAVQLVTDGGLVDGLATLAAVLIA